MEKRLVTAIISVKATEIRSVETRSLIFTTMEGRLSGGIEETRVATVFCELHNAKIERENSNIGN